MNLETSMNFCGDISGRACFYGSSVEKNNFSTSQCSVAVSNARTAGQIWELEEAGFTLVSGERLSIADESQAELTLDFVDQAKALLAALVETDRLYLSNHVIRSSENSDLYLKNGVKPPARFVHNDFGYGLSEAQRWVERILGGKEKAPYTRCATYNVWHPLTPPPMDVALAVCDVRTVDDDDRVGVDCHEELDQDDDWMFELSAFKHNDRQQWYYYPNMANDEYLVFKGFDTQSGLAQLTPHCAFDTNLAEVRTAPRVSIEARFLALF